jgi:hypothetical protein
LELRGRTKKEQPTRSDNSGDTTIRGSNPSCLNEAVEGKTNGQERAREACIDLGLVKVSMVRETDEPYVASTPETICLHLLDQFTYLSWAAFAVSTCRCRRQGISR